MVTCAGPLIRIPLSLVRRAAHRERPRLDEHQVGVRRCGNGYGTIKPLTWRGGRRISPNIAAHPVLAAASGPPKDSWAKGQWRIESNRRSPPLRSGSGSAGRRRIAAQDWVGVEQRPVAPAPKRRGTPRKAIERILSIVSSLGRHRDVEYKLQINILGGVTRDGLPHHPAHHCQG